MKKIHPSLLFGLFFLISLSLGLFLPGQATGESGESLSPFRNFPITKALSLSINSTINPATLNYLNTSISEAKGKGFQLIIIKMNTPGGLVTTTKDILTLFGTSDVPILVWVTPEGASATSAGAIISVGAHLLYMSPGTNIGAATPVTLGGDNGTEPEPDPETEKGKGKENPRKSDIFTGNDDMKRKSVNDLVALVQSLGHTRGRNAEAFGRMITQAASFPAEEAKKQGLIDGLANDLGEIWKSLHLKAINLKGKTIILHVPVPPEVKEKGMDLGQRILDIFANPSLAYLLFLLGAVLIYLELQAPGGFIAGAIGVVCLILAGISFQVLPINFGSLGLVVLSFVLFVLEAFIPSYGLLTLAGIVSLLFGSLFLFRSEDSYLHFQTSLVYSAVSAVGFFLGLLGYFWTRDLKKARKNKLLRNEKDPHGLLGKYGVVIGGVSNEFPTAEEASRQYFFQVKINGEFWNACAGQALHPGDHIQVVGQDNDKLLLHVTPLSNH